MKLLFPFLFLLTTLVSWAQDKPPILTDKLQKGIYRSFEEFLNNAPSLRASFSIATKSDSSKVKRGTADYKLVLNDSATKRRDHLKFWGVCDGENIYINQRVYGGPFNFKKMHGVGRYCYFKGALATTEGTIASSTAMGGVAGGLVSAAIIEIDGDYPFILNINNGKIFLLEKKILKFILKKDSELDSLYEQEERKGSKNTLLTFVQKYNERHADEIEYNRPQPATVTFYRRQKKERIEPINFIAGDTIQLSMNPNSLKQITWFNDSLDICVNETCKTIALEKKRINYVECSWRAGQPEFEKVEIKEGEFYEREIKTLRDRAK